MGGEYSNSFPDWVSAIANIVTAMATSVAVVFAIRTIRLYREQVRFESLHGLSSRLLASLFRFRNELRSIRRAVQPGEQAMSVSHAKQRLGWDEEPAVKDPRKAVFTMRWAGLVARYRELLHELAEAEAVWGENWAERFANPLAKLGEEWMKSANELCDRTYVPNAGADSTVESLKATVFQAGGDANPDAFERRIRTATEDSKKMVIEKGAILTHGHRDQASLDSFLDSLRD
ncbi:MAG: hypothetical protein JNM86_07885 [Phycisphaerae bacterium]|nr:hypothetical protein [Phycisphaerae bacterium]